MSVSFLLMQNLQQINYFSISVISCVFNLRHVGIVTAVIDWILVGIMQSMYDNTMELFRDEEISALCIDRCMANNLHDISFLLKKMKFDFFLAFNYYLFLIVKI